MMILVLVAIVVLLLLARRKKRIAFFHPFADAGGGGERLLWTAIETLVADGEPIVLYARSSDALLERVKEQFGIDIPQEKLMHIPLVSWPLLRPQYYPVATLFLQNIGALVVGLEAIIRCTPSVFVDTIGASFSYPCVCMFSTVIAYVHYPIVSSDMMRTVASQTHSFNNAVLFTRSRWMRSAKMMYYRIVASVYGLCGRCATHVFVNSTWTKRHIDMLWGHKNTTILFPPCDTNRLQALSLRKKERTILSVGQFRPEKNHELQIRIAKELAQLTSDFTFYIVGGSKNTQEKALARRIRESSELSQVHVLENVPYTDLLDLLARCSIGVHTMKEEHFGIGIIEFMASGIIPVAHNSGGPKEDIIVRGDAGDVGFLQTTAQEYAHAIHSLFEMHETEQLALRQRARDHVLEHFGNERFASGVRAGIRRSS